MKQLEVKKISKLFLTKKFLKKFFAYLFLILFFYIFSDFLLIFFLTFIFSYLFLSLGDFFKGKIDYVIDKLFKKNKLRKYLKKFFPLNSIIIFQYAVFLIFLIFTLSNVIPKVIDELVGLTDKVPFIKNEVSNIVTKLQDMVALNTEIGGSITEIVNTQDISIFFDIFNKLKSAGFLFFEILLSILLSYVFIIDRHKLKEYFLPIKKSNFSFFYHEYADFFERVVKSFGLIFKAQSIIAFVNALLTSLGLYFVGMMYNTIFPYFLTLIIFVFICGFIPVLGTFISSIPILFLGYKLGGVSADFALLCVVSLVHIVEAYYLNPKIVSSFLNLPVSLTFVILLISERFFGVAGLLIGVSFFYFLEGMLIDADKGIDDLIGK